MPILLSPTDKWWLFLRDHKKKNEGERPEFAMKCLSGRQQRELATKLDAFEESSGSVAAFDALFAIFRDLCVGWRRVYVVGPDGEPEEVVFDVEKIQDVVTYQQARELVYRVWSEGGPSPSEVNFSDSQSSTPSDKSASPDAAEGV